MTAPRLETQGSPTGWKVLFRTPIGLYRVGVGFVMGDRFTMLEHKGRSSGLTRRTVLEVVVNDPDAIYVVAAWGSEAQWLKNVKADPEVVFHLGARKYRTTAEMVTRERAHQLMQEYAAEHPKALGRLSRFMLDDPAETVEAEAGQVADLIPMVRLPKADSRGPGSDRPGGRSEL